MITKLFDQDKLSKQDKQIFVPFVNQRNFMGSLLSDSTKMAVQHKQNNMKKDIAMIDNIKKSTKEYLFDKKFNKMTRKLKAIEASMNHKEKDYGKDVELCLKSLLKATLNDLKPEQQTLYIDKSQEVNQKINQLKMSMKKRKLVGEKKRCQTAQLEEQFEQKEHLRTTKHSAFAKNHNREHSKINKQIFQNISNRSELMTDFTNSGLKYRYLIEGKKINPWRKWYKKSEVQLFPGAIVQVKQLQKSIY